jgi:hypothetical protein
MRSCNAQGLAVGAETRGFRLSGNTHPGGYNYGPATSHFLGLEGTRRVDADVKAVWQV